MQEEGAVFVRSWSQGTGSMIGRWHGWSTESGGGLGREAGEQADTPSRQKSAGVCDTHSQGHSFTYTSHADGQRH